MVDDSGGIEKLEQLQEHENTEIYSKAIKLLETYFGGSEDDCENLIPIADGNGKFAFGNKPSYCDFEMLNSFRVLEYCYGKKTLNQYYTPGIERYLKNVLELPQIVNYFNNTPQGKETVLYPGVDYGSSKRARL